jgi:hypothetical protein
MRRQDRDCFRVGLGLESITEGGQLPPQRLIILYDAIMDDSNPISSDWVGVNLARKTMRRPAGVSDPYLAMHRFVFEPVGEVDQLSLGPSSLDASVDQSRDAGRIITSILETA